MANAPRWLLFVMLMLSLVGLAFAAKLDTMIGPPLFQMVDTFPTVRFTSLPWTTDVALALMALSLLGILALHVGFVLCADTCKKILVEDMASPPPSLTA